VGGRIVETVAHSGEAAFPTIGRALEVLIVGHGLEGNHGVAELHRLVMAVHVGNGGC